MNTRSLGLVALLVTGAFAGCVSSASSALDEADADPAAASAPEGEAWPHAVDWEGSSSPARSTASRTCSRRNPS